ncbi:hypothetical protein Tco_1342594, partial [Tanacetum coccineum]
QNSTLELSKYREDNNEASFTVAEAKKIYAHELLTFNDTVACEAIYKWKTGLKEEMDARSDVCVCPATVARKADSEVTKGLMDNANENLLGMEIVRDQS